ncbi:hypothetical protein AMK17_04885 [Streptomyces sp. CB00072]|uniref:hypothetical protein n=1 Tax=Streptomyces sp. CB00072 TaxID=1703928 RepID=UPI00093D409E|nr:hypothetical protein [Streptomyces sp. CB00072]OKI59262.1 hypothetical protein AMK17_04885 [Streptomyces sp. CB00072]
MPDRRRRTAFRLPLPERSAPLMRERQSSSPDSPSPGSSSPGPSSSDSSSPGPSSPDSPSGSAPVSGSAGKPQEDNPFAAPPADRPDQPWQPRHPSGSDGDGGSDGNNSSGDRPSWGSQWSSKQPGRGNGGFGGRSGGNGSGPGGKGGTERPGGMRWDPTDPAQRRARYAVLGGMWAFFFALFDLSELALLLGALSTYWAISALRTPMKSASATDRPAGDGTDAAGATTGTGTGATAADVSGAPPAAPTPAAPQSISSRQQTTAAVSGLVTALLALLIVATTFTVQLVYRDYYTCVNDALTKTGQLACNDQLPKPLEPFFGVKE